MMTGASMASIISFANADKLWTWSRLSWSLRPQEWSHKQPHSFRVTMFTLAYNSTARLVFIHRWIFFVYMFSRKNTQGLIWLLLLLLVRRSRLNECESKSRGKQMIMFHVWLTFSVFLNLLKDCLSKPTDSKEARKTHYEEQDNRWLLMGYPGNLASQL